MMGNLMGAVSPDMISSVMRTLANRPELLNVRYFLFSCALDFNLKLSSRWAATWAAV